jgi:hypothetical protein
MFIYLPLDILRCIISLGYTVKLEIAGIFAFVLKRAYLGRHILFQDEIPVQSTRPPAQHAGKNIQCRGVCMIERNRMIANTDRRVRLGIRDHPLLGNRFEFLGDDLGNRTGRPRQPCEILFAETDYLVGIEVSHEEEGQIIRTVVHIIELVCLFTCDAFDIRRPADHRPSVRMRCKEHRFECFLEFAGRSRLDPQATFFPYHIPFRIKFPEYRL